MLSGLHITPDHRWWRRWPHCRGCCLRWMRLCSWKLSCMVHGAQLSLSTFVGGHLAVFKSQVAEVQVQRLDCRGVAAMQLTAASSF